MPEKGTLFLSETGPCSGFRGVKLEGSGGYGHSLDFSGTIERCFGVIPLEHQTTLGPHSFSKRRSLETHPNGKDWRHPHSNGALAEPEHFLGVSFLLLDKALEMS